MLDVTYRALGMMIQSGMDMKLELDEFKSFTKGSHRYTFKDSDTALIHTRKFIRNMLQKMILGTWKHYAIPIKPNRLKLKKLGLTQPDPNNRETFKLVIAGCNLMMKIKIRKFLMYST